jgi:NAD(P)H-dependent FMN reductase
MPKIKIIVGSTRPGRFGIKAGEWVLAASENHTDAEFELVDLQDFNLPLLDEPMPAASGQYSKAHTKRWSEAIGDADGFIFVTGEYNHTIPGALKNAIDFLYREWNHKPAAFVGYGAEAGGTRSIEHLRSSLAQVKIFDLQDFVLIPNYWSQLSESGEFKPTDGQITGIKTLLDHIVFWADKMQPAREELEQRQLQTA